MPDDGDGKAAASSAAVMAMAAASMATAAGVAVVLYFLISGRVSSSAREKAADMDGDELARAGRAGRRRILRRPAQAPATWLETLATLSEIIRFTYSETLGKWPIGDLAFGINYLLRRQVIPTFVLICVEFGLLRLFSV